MHNESVTSTEGRPSASGAATRGDAVRGHIIARIVTIVVALFWGVLFFGVIDLITVPIHDETFYQHYLIETGWGLLYTLLVMVPLILWAVRPQWRVFPQQVFVVAAAVLLTGLLTRPKAGTRSLPTHALGSAVPGGIAACGRAREL